MIQKYKHISFDLDGTLVETVREHRCFIVPKIVDELGGAIDDYLHIDEFWFKRDRNSTIKEKFRVDPEKFWKIWREMDTPDFRSKNTKPYKDTEYSLKKLKGMGKIISIITGSQKNIADMEIKKINGIQLDYFLSIFDNKFKEKPDPKSFHFVLNKLKIRPKETLYIGNSDEDALYAKKAGVDFIHIDRKEYPFDLEKYATRTIKSLEELFGT